MRKPCGRKRNRRGIVLVVLIVAIAVITSIFLSILKLAAVDRAAADLRFRQAQAAFLTDAALDRAAARLAADPDYKGETWKITADEMDGRDSSVATIHVAAVGSDRREVTVESDYPADIPVRAHHRRQAVISIAQGKKS